MVVCTVLVVQGCLGAHSIFAGHQISHLTPNSAVLQMIHRGVHPQPRVPIPSLFALCTAGLLCCVAVQSTLYWAVHRSPDPKATLLAT